jgi:transposase-like protein
MKRLAGELVEAPIDNAVGPDFVTKAARLADLVLSHIDGREFVMACPECQNSDLDNRGDTIFPPFICKKCGTMFTAREALAV